MSVDSIIDAIIRAEGEQYTNDPSDSGGPTKYGVTQAALSAYRGQQVSAEAVEMLTRDEAEDVYYRDYVIKPGFNAILDVAPDVGAELVDSGVNCGPGRPSKWLQRCLNVLNNGGDYYADISVDGDIGPGTLRALTAYLAKRGKAGEAVLLLMLRCLQGAFYIELAERRGKDEKYVYGWLSQRV